VKHVGRFVTRVVGGRLAENEAHLAATEGALLRALERIEVQHAQQAPAAPKGFIRQLAVQKLIPAGF